MNELRKAMRVLVVDDEKVIADTLALILNRSGFDATAVYSGEAAVETAMNLKPHVVISDVAMGTMTGIEAGRLICQAVPGCRVILFSGQAATVDQSNYSASGDHLFEVLIKPVPPRVFIQRLSSHADSVRSHRDMLVPQMAF